MFLHKDEKYKQFNAKIIPQILPEQIIGVRVPILKKLASKFVKDNNYKEFLSNPQKYYLEEFILYGFIVDKLNLNFLQTVEFVENILPYINNWATCDLLSFNVFKNNINLLMPYIQRWLKSTHEYTQRFGLVVLIKYFTKQNFTPQVFKLALLPNSKEPCVVMAQGWLYSYLLMYHYNQTLPLFLDNSLPKDVHNTAIKKAIESRVIDSNKKAYLKTLKK